MPSLSQQIGRSRSSLALWLKWGGLVAVLGGLLPRESAAQIFTWNVDAAGQWTDNANWSPNTGNPNAAGDTARFLNVITANRTVTINSDRTVGEIEFDAANNYTLLQSGGGTDLLINNGGSDATITVNTTNGNGAHTVDIDLILQDDLIITNNSTGDLSFQNNISGSQNITIEGNGSVQFNASNSFTGDVTLDGGTLVIINNNRLGNNANDVFIDGGTLETTGGGNLNFNAGRVFTIEAGGATFFANGRNQTYNDTGQITGSGTLTKTGGSNMTISAAMTTFTGDVEIDAGRITVGNDDALGTGGTAGNISLNNSGAQLGVNDSIGLRILNDYSDVAGAQLRPGDSDAPISDTFVDGIHFANNQTNTINANIQGLDTTNDDFAVGADGASTVVNFNGTWDGDGGNVSSYMVVQNGATFNVTASAVIDTRSGGSNSRPFYIVGDGPDSVVEFEEGFVADSGLNMDLASVRLAGATWITNSNDNLNGFMFFADIAGGVWNTATNDQVFDGTVGMFVNGSFDTDTNMTLNGTLIGGGQLTKEGAESLILTNSGSTHSGAILVEEGTLRVAADTATGSANFGNAVSAGATLEYIGGVANAEGEWQISGTGTTGTNGAIFNVSGNNSESSQINLNADALITSDADTLTLSGPVNIDSNALTVDGDGQVSFTGLINSTTTLNIQGSGTKSFTGSQINGGGTINVTGNGSHTIDSTINLPNYVQSGTSTVTFGGTGNNNLITATVNAGTLILDKTSGYAVRDVIIGNGVTTGLVQLAQDDQIADFEDVVINAGSTLDLNGFDDEIETLTMTEGTVNTGVGTLSVDKSGADAVTVNAAATSSTINGNLELSGFQPEFVVADGAASDDLLINALISGTQGLAKSGAGRMTLANASNSFSGQILVEEGILSVSSDGNLGAGTTDVTLDGGTLEATGSFTYGAGRDLTIGASDGTLDVGANTVVLASGGTFGGAGEATINGSGTVQLDREVTVSNLNVTEGTLLLGAADRIANTTNLGLGGTLATGGFSDTLGTLTLTDNAVLDLGSGASILSFAASGGETWSGGLTITNWSGDDTGGGLDQVIFGTTDSGLNSGQVNSITFVNPVGFDPGNYGARILSTGEIVPIIPEPETYAAAACMLLLGGLMEFRRRRKVKAISTPPT